MSGAPLLFANLGAEEGAAWRRMARHARVRAHARAWAALFARGACFAGGDAPSEPELAEPLARDAAAPAFEFCAAQRALVPWLATAEAEALARECGVPLAGPAPELVARVHDKAFALEAAQALGLVPEELRGRLHALGPDAFADLDTAQRRLREALADWPAELRARLVLKPRLGTSGRGRLAARGGELAPETLAAALPRLRERGGAIAEPWLERTQDLSAQLFVAGPDDVRVLGTLRQWLSREGTPLAHAGRLGMDGAVDSGSAHDAELRAAALALGGAAARAGFRGACGVDAFAFRAADGAERLRPVVELNARFTAGTTALGLVARALRSGATHGASAFALGFPPSGRGWPSPPPAGVELLPVLSGEPELRLALAADANALDALFAPTLEARGRST